jgi:predicted membrane protein
VRSPSPLKALALVINIAIAVYLVWRKQLFLTRQESSAARA